MSVKGLRLLPFVAATMFTVVAFAKDRPPSMLGGSFDLKSAILSPAPLGPPSQFEPPPVAAKPEATKSVAATPEAKSAPAPAVATSEATAPRKTIYNKPRQKTAVAARKPKANPLDSYARDARRQSWPCTGGGICAWTQPR